MADAFDLSGRVAVVTGSGRGIGRGIALCLAAAGADIVVNARRQDDVEATVAGVRDLGRQARGVVVDVTSAGAFEQLVAAANELGDLSIWVNNAGGLPDSTPRYLTRTPEDRWDAQMDLNLKSVWQGAVAAAQAMESGVIINISSRAASGPGRKNGPYGAAKAAVNSLTESLALELAPRIRVNAVAPGSIPTDNFLESTSFPEGKPIEKMIGVPLERLGTAEDIGNAVVFMAAPASSWITGQCLYVTGGL